MGLFSSTIKPPAKKNIFISYRVNDTSGETGRLVDSLKQCFSDDQIFIDIEKIEPGVDFTVAIARSLESCDVMLAIIGPNWQGLNPSTNTSRISNENDWVRLEISTALQRNIRVVPVLVDGAELPVAEQLPDDLQPLLKRQAYEISNKRWKYDTDELIKFLVRSIGITPKYQTQQPVKQEKSWWAKNYVWVTITGVLLVVFAIIRSLSESGTVQNMNTNTYEPREKVHDNPPAEPVVEKTYSSDGIWYDAKGLYYFQIFQNESYLTINSYTMAGVLSGQGTGNIKGNEVNLNMTFSGSIGASINMILASDERNLTGTSRIENNGTVITEPIHLIKK